MIKAVIFDMDGVLIDSEPVHFESDKLTFRDYGLEVTDSVLYNYVGTSNSEMWKRLRIEFNIPATVDEILKKQMKYKKQLFSGETLIPVEGVAELLRLLKNSGAAIGLASSSPRDFIQLIIESLRIDDFFQVIVSGEEVNKGKPEPDIFLKTAELLGAAPYECIVIEDSENGVRAAKSAGMKSIGYRNPNSGCQDLSASSYIVDSISEAAGIVRSLL